MSATTKPLPSQLRYRAGLRAAKVAAFTAFSAACAFAALRYGLELGQSWGLRPADGGVLKPLAQRAALGASVAVLGLAFFAGMVAFLRHFVLRIDPEDGGRTVRIARLPPYPALRLPSAQVRAGRKLHRAQPGALAWLSPRSARVKSPWLSLHLPGWRWPLLLDLLGRFEDGERRRIPPPEGWR